MTCRDVVRLFSDYLAGDLPAHLEGPFRTHLRRCLKCRTFLRQLRATIEAGRLAATAPDEADRTGQAPDELVREVLRAIRTAG